GIRDKLVTGVRRVLFRSAVLILAADSSLPILSVALLADRTLLGAVALEGKGSRNEKLLPAIDWLLVESGIDRKEIELFATTRGQIGRASCSERVWGSVA